MAYLSIIIVNYNGWPYLRECLLSLRQQTYTNLETIVVDNGSSDGSSEKIKTEFPEVIPVVSERNLGFGGGNNLGLNRATGKLIAFINNDTVLDSRWAEEMVRAARNASEDYGMFTSKILNIKQPGLIDNTGLLLYPDGIARGRGRLEKDEGQYDNLRDVFLPSGCGCVFKREVLETTGGYDEDFFLYLEDVDLGLRARLNGWKCMFVPEAIIYHHYSATTSPYSSVKAFYVERNRLFIITKHYPLKWVFLSIPYTLLRYWYQFVGLLKGKGAVARVKTSEGFFKMVWTLARAYIAGFLWVPRNLKKRWDFKKRVRVRRTEWDRWFRKYRISPQEVAWKD